MKYLCPPTVEQYEDLSFKEWTLFSERDIPHLGLTFLYIVRWNVWYTRC